MSSTNIDSLLVFIVTFTDVLAVGIASVLFVNNVLHWKVRNGKKTCLVFSVLSLVCAIIMSLFYFLGVQQNTDINALSEDLILPFFIFLIWILLAVRTEGRVWKRLIVIFFATSIVINIQTRFSYIPDYLENSISNTLLSTLYEILASLLVLLFVWFLTRISRKDVNRPVRTGTVALLGMLLFIFDQIVLDTFKLVATDPNALLLDLSLCFTKPDSPESVIFYLLLNILLYLAALILAFFLFAQKSENKYYKEMVDANTEYLIAQSQYYEAVDKSNSEIRKIRHDMRNHLTVLTLLLENKDYSRMTTYLEEINDFVQTTDTGLHKGNTIADVILYDKANKAMEAGCNLVIEGLFTFTGMSALDTCAIVGNILDNAIEASSEMPPENREITLAFSRTDNFFIISENNRCHKRIIADNNILPTTKSDRRNHGFGLMNIREAVARYDGEVQMSCEHVDDDLYLFCIEVIIPLN